MFAAAASAVKFADVPGDYRGIGVGFDLAHGGATDDQRAQLFDWLRYEESSAASLAPVDKVTASSDPALLYFTSGTTSLPKIVVHSHTSYPLGHLSTMSWLGVQPGDTHLVISAPGWAKHAWSSFSGPWRRRDRLCCELRPLRRRVPRLRTRPRRRQHVLRAAHRVAHADPAPPRTQAARPARTRLGWRTPQPRGHRPHQGVVGPRDSRRLRPDRDHRAHRQPARRPHRARRDGQATAQHRRRAR